MNRRTLLATAGVAVAGLLGGCSDTGDSGTDGETGTAGSSAPNESTGTTRGPGTTQSGSTSGAGTTATASPPTTAAEPTTATASTSTATTTETPTSDTQGTTGTPVPDAQSTQEGSGASVTFENGGSRVVVAGTIIGQDGCRRAVLDSVQANDGTLVVSVGTERDVGTNTMCTQALTPVDYRFVLTPEDPPESVTVVHDTADGRRTVTTADRDA